MGYLVRSLPIQLLIENEFVLAMVSDTFFPHLDSKLSSIQKLCTIFGVKSN